jgi:hypothetical protein
MSFDINILDKFNTIKNESSWDKLHTYVASILTVNGIPLENVFFVNTPSFVAFFSEFDNAIFQRPASDFSTLSTRKVIVEKCKQSIKFKCVYDRKLIIADKIISKSYSVMNYKLNWNASSYGDGFDLMNSMRVFLKSKSHLAIFLYVDDSFFETIQDKQIIRIVALDTTAVFD